MRCAIRTCLASFSVGFHQTRSYPEAFGREVADGSIPLKPRGGGGQAERRDREKEPFGELIRRLSKAFAADLNDSYKLVFVMHIAETFRANEQVVAQVSTTPASKPSRETFPARA